MTTATYRVSINGFWCRNQTWDNALRIDGKDDEVFLDVNVKVIDPSGAVTQNFDSESELMGDTWNLPNRIQAGSASDRGGIISGDKFPTDQPWRRTGPPNDRRVPPYTIWEGALQTGQGMVMLTPTVWEWDEGAGFWDGWLAWQVEVDTEYGKRAKEIYGGLWPAARPVFDAVSLGIQTVGTLAGLWSPLGQSMRRPIGLRRDPNNPDGFVFNPATIGLTAETADYLSSANLQGYGNGIVELRYVDDPYLRGVYSIFVQVEKLADTVPGWSDVGHANDVVAMAAMEGRLFAATSDNTLWRRDAVSTPIDWTHIGHANSVTGLAATGRTALLRHQRQPAMDPRRHTNRTQLVTNRPRQRRRRHGRPERHPVLRNQRQHPVGTPCRHDRRRLDPHRASQQRHRHGRQRRQALLHHQRRTALATRPHALGRQLGTDRKRHRGPRPRGNIRRPLRRHLGQPAPSASTALRRPITPTAPLGISRPHELGKATAVPYRAHNHTAPRVRGTHHSRLPVRATHLAHTTTLEVMHHAVPSTPRRPRGSSAGRDPSAMPHENRSRRRHGLDQGISDPTGEPCDEAPVGR